MTHTTTPVDTTALEAAYETASAALSALQTEQAGIAQSRAVAIAMGDADHVVTLDSRAHELPTRLTMARLAYAKAGLAWSKAVCYALEAHYAANPPPTVSAVDTGGLSQPMMPEDIAMARMRLRGFHDAYEQALREAQR